jgi:predicted  nucleic acid-binding Zn-ribbon protein
LGTGALADYDDLRQRFGGIAVVVLKRGICQTCGVDVPTSVARAVERGEGVHYCPVCSRLMVAG